jgi:hypothetical protein
MFAVSFKGIGVEYAVQANEQERLATECLMR